MNGESIKIDGIDAKAGEIKKISLKIGELANGSPMYLPVFLIKGLEAGPTLYVGSGIHGEEVAGMEAVKSFAADIDPKKLKGTIIAAPLVNVPAFIFRTRLFPLEGASPSDVERVSASPSGKLTQRVANLILEEVASKADYALDIHATHIDSENYPRATTQPHDPKIAKEVIEKMDQMSKATGLEVIQIRPKFSPSGFIGSLISRGIPTIGLETGEGWRATKKHVDIIIRSIKNVMMHLSMLEGVPKMPQMQVITTKRQEVLANRGGLMQPKVKPGDYVSKGDVVAEITNMFNEVVEQPKSPANGIIIRASKLPIVFTGARVCCVYETEKAEWRDRVIPKLEKSIIDGWDL